MSPPGIRTVITVFALSLGALLLPTAADSNESEEPRVAQGQRCARRGVVRVRTSGSSSDRGSNEIQLTRSPLPLESFRPTAGYTFADRRVVLTGDTRDTDLLRCAVVGLDALGTPTWTLRIRGPGDTQALDLAPASGGAVLITGHMERQGQLGEMKSELPCGELVSAFAATVDGEGKGRWLASPVTGTHRWSVGMAGASLAEGRLLVVGEVERKERRSVFTCVYSADGKRQQFATLPGALGEDHPVPIGPSADGGFFLARHIRDSTTRQARAHVSCHRASTSTKWDKTLNDAGSLHITGLAATPCGGVIATGYAFGSVHIRGREYGTSDRQATGYVVALDDSGEIQWIRHLVAKGADGYVLPLGLHMRDGARVEVVCLGHGDVHGTDDTSPLLKLLRGHFVATYTFGGALEGSRELGRESDGDFAIRIPGEKWLGLTDLR